MDATLTWSKTFDSFQPTEIAGENGNLILDEIHIARKAEIVPHAAPTSGLGPKPGRTVICEGLPYNEYYYEFKEFADLIEQGKKESVHNSLATSLAVWKSWTNFSAISLKYVIYDSINLIFAFVRMYDEVWVSSQHCRELGFAAVVEDVTWDAVCFSICQFISYS